MNEYRVPSDVIKAIFHYLGESDNSFRFSAKASDLHNLFYQLAEEEKLATLFSDFIFDTSKMYPYCETISYALDRLQKANFLESINPRLNEFQISITLSNWKIEETELFDEREIGLLKEAANKFKSLVEV